MQNNLEVKNKIKELLDENKNDDAVALFKDFTIQYKSNEGHSRKLTLKQVASMLAVVLKNTTNKIIIQKISTAIENVKQAQKI